MSETVELRNLDPSEISTVVDLISAAMNADEGKWADSTIRRHFQLADAGIDDGRTYLCATSENKIIGIVGLHHYEWGPTSNVWLGWFAVLPRHQNSGIGTGMLTRAEEEAVSLGYNKLLIETYSSPDFISARQFYTKRGYIPTGQISDYIDQGIHMIVYSKSLANG